jgi:hypothetical protein
VDDVGEDVSDVELAALGELDGVEPATLLDPEEQPASTATTRSMRESRRIVITLSVVGCVIAR